MSTKKACAVEPGIVAKALQPPTDFGPVRLQWLTVNEPPPQELLPDNAQETAGSTSRVMWAVVFGLLAATGYTASVACVRAAVKDIDPVWVGAVREAPNMILVLPLLLWYLAKKRPILPPASVMKWLLLGTLVCHLGGNISFVWSIKYVGMSTTVPIMMGMIIFGGALLSYVMLGEPIANRSWLAMSLLVMAIVIITISASSGTEKETAAAKVTLMATLAGVALAITAGTSFALTNIAFRFCASRCPLPTLVFIVGAVGVLVLGGVYVLQNGFELTWSLSTYSTTLVVMAGVINTLAFFCLIQALKLASVILVNALNASQVAMGAIVGWIVFHEYFSLLGMFGICITIIGLVLMKENQPEKVETIEL